MITRQSNVLVAVHDVQGLVKKLVYCEKNSDLPWSCTRGLFIDSILPFFALLEVRRARHIDDSHVGQISKYVLTPSISCIL